MATICNVTGCFRTAKGTPRCGAHERSYQRERNASRGHYKKGWAARSRQLRQAYVATHGRYVEVETPAGAQRRLVVPCPGFEVPEHLVSPEALTVDHVRPRDSTPTAELRVLCRSCNSRKGATVDRAQLKDSERP